MIDDDFKKHENLMKKDQNFFGRNEIDKGKIKKVKLKHKVYKFIKVKIIN